MCMICYATVIEYYLHSVTDIFQHNAVSIVHLSVNINYAGLIFSATIVFSF